MRHPGSVRPRRFQCAAAATLLAIGLAACSSRVSAEEVEEIARLLELAPGKTVADVGAGDGKWAVELARRVAEEGKVYATEITEKLVGEIEERVRGEALANVEVVLSSQRETGLPEGCCDAILLRMVYHHFEQPGPMRAGIRRALRPGGLVAVIDIVPQADWRELPGVPERGGHGIAPEDLVAELTADGFETVSRHDDWNGDPERYCLVFRLAPPRANGSPPTDWRLPADRSGSSGLALRPGASLLPESFDRGRIRPSRVPSGG